MWCKTVSQIGTKCSAIGRRGADRQTEMDGCGKLTEGLINGLETKDIYSVGP